MRIIRRAVLGAGIALAIAAAPALAKPSVEARRLQSAEKVLKEVTSAPDKRIPSELLERAECIGVFPGVAKGAFVVGGEYGHGVFTCRQKDGSMSAPAFFKVGGGSVGWQVGGQSADLVMLVMNPSGTDHLLRSHFTIGGDAAAVAGPVGRRVEASTDAQLHAQILTWSRSRGAFVGASLDGKVIKPDMTANAHIYGRNLSARKILLESAVPVPESALGFTMTTARLTRAH